MRFVHVNSQLQLPYVPNANNYAPMIMLAEKAADLILGNTPLVEEVDFYRHRKAYVKTEIRTGC